MKVCSKCQIEKSLSEFRKQKGGKFGVRGDCRKCHSERDKEWRIENKDTLSKKQRVYYESHKQERKQYHNNYRKLHEEKYKVLKKMWKENNRQKMNEHEKQRRKTDINYKLAHLLRSRIGKVVSGTRKGGSAVTDLGCSIEEFKTYLESKFQPEMTWENYGRKGWVIDHIKPLASFNLTNREEFLMACHYTNMQPLWEEQNLRKWKHYENQNAS